MNRLPFFRFMILAIAALAIAACEDDSNTDPVIPTETGDLIHYFVGIESGTDPTVDVLAFADSLTAGTVSPVNNGFEQPAGWSVFFQGVDQIFSYTYTSAPEYVSYELVGGELKKGDSFFTDLSAYAIDVADEATMVVVGNGRSGLTDKKIYLINTNTMSIEKTVESNFGDIAADSLFAFPADAEVRDDKLFVAYYHTHARGDFSTPQANTAYLAVFSFPGLEFEKIIEDDRAPNLGRYFTTNALQVDEKGDMYTYASSSLACGFNPIPSKNSAILRVKNGETEFDDSYYVDFETLSGGYKINDLFYVANGKAVVKVIMEDETNSAYHWGSYAPNAATPIVQTGIVDLYNKTFKLLTDVPNSGGGWNSAFLVEGTKLYLGCSSSDYSSIYIIDTETETAVKGVDIDGNYAKGIHSLIEEK